MSDWIGYKWLAERYDITTVQPLLVESRVGSSRRTTCGDPSTQEIYTPNMRPADTLASHLTFALKHEGTHLEFLARLFSRVPSVEFANWVNRERTGQYARRIGFLWEWWSGCELPGVSAVTSGNYVEAIDSNDYLSCTQPSNNARWRVRDNLPGNRFFCPTVRRTKAIIEAASYDCAKQLNALQAQYGTDVLMRSAVWLTIKESRASFLIEHEEKQVDRIQRFAAVMERRCGEHRNPLDRAALAELQREVIGDKSTLTHFGVRKSPVFVGETAAHQQVVHYIAPHWTALDDMLRGMESFLERTRGASAIARAAVTSFGFVYLHPLVDGNGRLHRFLINDMLRRDNAVPKPFILPVSAAITNKPQDRARYDTVLSVFSKPFMERYRERYAFEPSLREHEDKVASDFVFADYADAAFAWRYLDLTQHVEYLAELIDVTIRQEMREEAHLLRSWDHARDGIKEIMDGPDRDLDRIIRAVRGHGGKISNRLAKEFVVLADVQVANRVTEVIAAAFDPGEGTDGYEFRNGSRHG